jgi:hypothetical protein
MLLTCFTLVSVIDFLVSGQLLGKGCDWGSLEGSSYHSQPYLPLSISCSPTTSPSSRFSGLIDPRRACTSFHGKKGLKAQRDCSWKKLKAKIITFQMLTQTGLENDEMFLLKDQRPAKANTYV